MQYEYRFKVEASWSDKQMLEALLRVPVQRTAGHALAQWSVVAGSLPADRIFTLAAMHHIEQVAETGVRLVASVECDNWDSTTVRVVGLDRYLATSVVREEHPLSWGPGANDRPRVVNEAEVCRRNWDGLRARITRPQTRRQVLDDLCQHCARRGEVGEEGIDNWLALLATYAQDAVDALSPDWNEPVGG